LVKDNLILIGWISQIYGVLWAVWIAQFFDKLTKCTQPTLWGFDLSQWYVYGLIGAGFLFLVYTFYLIKWLWSVRKVTSESDVRSFFGGYRIGLVYSIIATVAILLLGATCNSILASGVGAFVTLGWIVIVMAVLLFDWRTD